MVTETGHIVAGFNSEKHLAEADVFVLHELVKRSFAKRFIIFFVIRIHAYVLHHKVHQNDSDAII